MNTAPLLLLSITASTAADASPISSDSGWGAAVGWFAAGAASAAIVAFGIASAWRSRLRRQVERDAQVFEARDSALKGRLRDLEAILQSTTNGFVAMDPQQHILDLNGAGASMLGVAIEDARGRLLPEVARHPALNRFVSEVIGRSESSEAELELEGRPARSVRAAAEPLRDPTGRSLGVLVSLQDITRIRRLESLRSDFVSNVSHELRTPITAIKGYVETLLQIGSDDPVRVRKFLEVVQRNTTRLSNLVEDLLALASLEQDSVGDRNTIEMGPVSAASIVQDVCEQLAPHAEARRITLERTSAPGLRVVVNRVLAEQALANLVSNAARYAKEGTRVRIHARELDAASAEFAVTDEGPGIAPKHLERIFERFYRVDRSRARGPTGSGSADGGGTGLGLAIVKHIAQVHGGRVEVESTLGVGSTFRLVLPRAMVANEN